MKILIHDLMQYSDLPDELKSPSLANEYANDGPISVTFSLPAAIAEIGTIAGKLSQPMYVGTETYDGNLSQPLFPITAEETLTNDLGETLTNDLSEDLTAIFFDELTDDFYDGFLSKNISVIGVNEFDCLGVGGTDATEITINGEVALTTEDGLSFVSGLYELPQTLQAGVITIEHNGSYMGRLACGKCREMCAAPSREPGFYTTIKQRETLSGQVIEGAAGYGGEEIGVDFRYKVDKDIYSDFRLAYKQTIMKGFPFFLDFGNDEWFPRSKFYGQTDNSLLFQSAINGFKFSRRFSFMEKF